LDISGHQLTAESKAALSPGQKLQLQVIETNPQIELKIVSNKLDQFFGRSLTLLGKNIDLSVLFQTFDQYSPAPLNSLTSTTRNVLENFFSLQQSNFSDKDSGAVLKQLIDRLGLTLENALARGDKASATNNLKASLLDIAHNFQSTENIAEATTKILTTLELFQLAQLHNQNDKQFIFPLPLPFVEQGYLIVERRDASESDGIDGNTPNSRFSLHLTMTDLGNIQIDFLSVYEKLYIRFRTDSQAKADFVAQFGDQLKDAITDISDINLSFSADAPDPLTELIRHIVPEGDSILDTKA